MDVLSIMKFVPLQITKGSVMPKGMGATFLTPIILELISRGHEVIIFTLDKETNVKTVLEGKNLKVYIGHYRRKYRAVNFFRTEIKNLKKMIESEKLDVLHAHWTYEFAIAAQSSHNRVLLTAHDSPLKVMRYMPNFYRFVRLLLAYYSLNKAEFLTAVSQDTANHLIKYKFYNKSNLDVIPNPVLIDEGIKNHTENKEIIFASVMNGWGTLKNPIALLEAFQLLRKEYNNVKLIMIGKDYGELEQAEQWAKKNNCKDGVVFKGELDRFHLLNYLLKEVDVLVHPSLEESFSLIIAETMKLGIPIIGGKYSGAVPYTMGNGAAGLLIDVKSKYELKCAMESLMKEEVRNKYGQSGYEFATKHFKLKNIVDKYERVYLKIINNH